MNTTVSFELAKLLKEKGFKNGIHYDGVGGYFTNTTIAEVVMWLYEKHGIFVTVTIPYSEFGKFSAEIWSKESDNIKILLVDGMSVFNTINQAYEEGIIESLKLI